MTNHQLPKLRPSPKIASISISILLISFPVLYASLLRISPANLLNDTAFCFLLSNSIVLIVAADCGVFSSSPRTAEPDDGIYDEYVARSSALPIAAHHHHPYVIDKEKERSDDVHNVSVDLNRAVVAAGETKLGRSQYDVRNVSMDLNRAVIAAGETKLGRSRSETAAAERRCREVEESKVVRRSATVTEKRSSSCGEEESEYWRMSDEELNERVENFIKRFNREIRMEAIMT